MSGSAAATSSQRHQAPAWLRALATALWLAGLVLAAAIVLLRVEIARLGRAGPADVAQFAAVSIDILVYGALGRLLVARRPRELVGWLFLVTPVAGGIVFAGFSVTPWAVVTGRFDDPLVAVIASVAPAVFAPTILLALPLLALLFPDGRLPGPRWRWPTVFVIAAALASCFSLILMEGQLDPTLPPNPFGIPGSRAPLMLTQGLTTPVALLGGTALGVAAVVVRLRRAGSMERHQLAWFLGALLVEVVLGARSFSNEGEVAIVDVFSALSLSLLPAAVTLAILRYRLYDIDRIVSRGLGYAIVTAVLVATFAGAVLGLQALLADVTGGDTAPVALSTLLVFSLFQPLRARVQGAIDRRFHRARVDAAKAIDAFGSRLRDEVDLATVRAGTLQTADTLVHPVSAGLWLRSR